MKRAPIVLTATALGLGATLGFNAHRPEAAATTAAATTTAATTASSSTSSPSTASTASTSSSAAKTVTSDVVSTQYGDLQLKVTIKGGKITDVQPVQLPSDDPKSVEIGQYAAPALRTSALSKQSAEIDVVSGATYTSQGYKTALQSALDKGGFSASSASGSAA